MITGTTEDRSLFKKMEIECAFFDEGHMLKNMKSQRFTNLMKVKVRINFVLES